MAENEGLSWSWQAPEPAVTVTPAEKPAVTPAEKPAEKPAKAKPKSRAKKPHAGAKAHAGAGEHEKKTTVKIEHVTLNDGIVSVHGTVAGKAASARFHERDVKALPEVKERQAYVARHLKSVADTPVVEPEGLEIVGNVEV